MPEARSLVLRTFLRYFRKQRFAILLNAAAAQPPLFFSTSTELVRVVVSVTDPQGRPIRGLRREDFTLKDDAKRREIVSSAECGRAKAETPADCQAGLGLLLDTSHSMESVLEPARDAAVAFAASVPEARVSAVVSFESKVTTWPADGDQLGSTLDLVILESKGTGTRFFEGVLRAAESVTSDHSPRPILVAPTDGEDTEGVLRKNPSAPQGRSRPEGCQGETSHRLRRGGDPPAYS